MCNYTDEDRSAKLRNILFELSKSQETLKEDSARTDVFVELEKVYYIENNELFRHYYSDIFSILTQIKSDTEKGDVNILGQNLSLIKLYYRPVNTDKDGKLIDISDSIRKLYDHINLDIARMSYSDAQDWKLLQRQEISRIKSQVTNISSELDNKKTQIDTLATNVNDVTDKANTLQDKIDSSQKEYIAILGIFSAVVLAFTAGIAFSTSVLENIHLASVYRLIFICCIIGLVLTDIIYLIFRYVEKIVYGSKNKSWCQQYLPIMITNAAIILVMLLTVVAWRCGWVEKRNNTLSPPVSVQATHETPSGLPYEQEKDSSSQPPSLQPPTDNLH